MAFGLKLEKQTINLLTIAGVALTGLYLINNQYGVEFQKIVSIVLSLLVGLFLIFESNYKMTVKQSTKGWRKVVGGMGLVVGVALLVGLIANVLSLSSQLSWLEPYQTVLGWSALVLFVLLAVIE